MQVTPKTGDNYKKEPVYAEIAMNGLAAPGMACKGDVKSLSGKGRHGMNDANNPVKILVAIEALTITKGCNHDQTPCNR